jgi:hypothetical protein
MALDSLMCKTLIIVKLIIVQIILKNPQAYK